MKAERIHSFGPPNAIVIDEIPRPTPQEGELVVWVAAAGVGPWDALIREGKSVVQLSLPIILGSDLVGIVDSVGTGVIQFKPGDEVFGVTNQQFCGAYAEYAVASAQMVAASLSFVEAASVPGVAVTAQQMLFDYAQMKAGQAVLIHGAAGNVGAYAVQLARQAELQVFATAGPADLDYVLGLGAEMVVNYKTTKFEDAVPPVDAVLETVGGETQHGSFRVLKRAVSSCRRFRRRHSLRAFGGRGLRALARRSSEGARNAGRCAAQQRKDRTYDAWRSLDTAPDARRAAAGMVRENPRW